MIDSKYVYRGQIIKDAVDEKICYADYVIMDAFSGQPTFWQIRQKNRTAIVVLQMFHSSKRKFATCIHFEHKLCTHWGNSQKTAVSVSRKCCMFLRISVASNKSRCLLPISGWNDRVREKLETGSNKLRLKQMFLILVG